MNDTPVEKCNCASFFTVRGEHKKDCPTYEPPKGDVNIGWELRFDEKYQHSRAECAVFVAQGKDCNCYVTDIKSFIHTLLLSARAEERERIVALVKGMDKEVSEMIIANKSPILGSNFGAEGARAILSDLLTRMRGVKD